MSIVIQSLEFHYPKSTNRPILDIESLTVSANEKLFLHGPSGCGKSTLLNLISGMLSPVKGEVKVLEKSLDKMSLRQRDHFRAHNIGYVFQQFNLIPYLSAIDNIKLASHFVKKSSTLKITIYALLARLHLSESDWHKPVSQLSIGQQQRIAIARALINAPKLFIADEPTSSLDSTNRDQFISLLMALCEEYQMTLLFVSHDTNLSHHFDRTENLPLLNRATKEYQCFSG